MTPEAPAILATRTVGEEAAQIAARYGVACAPDVPVQIIRRGAGAIDQPIAPREISAAAFRIMLRRNRFKTADRRAARAAKQEEQP